MDTRWSLLLAFLLVGVALASEEEDSIPDVGVEEEDSDELSLDQEETRNLRPRAYTPSAYNALPSGFRPTPSLAELAGYQQRPQQQEQQEFVVARPQQQVFVEEQRAPPRPVQRRPQQDQRPIKFQQQQLEEAEEELEDEKEEPDRLSQLLQQSKFNCVGKQTGYYADEELSCEVFHYCQDSVKHSWICPDGFTFHQVHLICMPPTHDNICTKSSKYHFVNEYLYKPVNQDEVDKKPNLSLKYSDRYYPAEVYRDDRYEQEEEDEEEAPRRQPQPQAQQIRVSPRPQPAQVFRSAEEVNIPLGQRRPQRPYDFDF